MSMLAEGVSGAPRFEEIRWDIRGTGGGRPGADREPGRAARGRGRRRIAASLLVLIAGAHGAFAQETPAPPPGPSFSTPRGHAQEAFSLVLTAPDAGASLRVSTDGSLPSEAPAAPWVSGATADGRATATLRVDRTMSVRAAAVDAQGRTSEVVTHSYVFPDQVLRQGEPEQEFPKWGHSGPDWEMDPDVVGHDDLESRVVASDLLTLPALYLSLPFADFWGPEGIYIEGEGDARAASVELLNPAGSPVDANGLPGLQVDGTVEITGGSSTERWKTDKLSMRLRFEGGIEFPVFEHAPATAGVPATRTFHTLILDARLNESWNHPSDDQREGAQSTRDQFIADVQNATGGLAPHGRHVHLYVAGMYWGVYTLHERPDHHFAESYRGGRSRDYNVVKHNLDDVVHGENVDLVRLRDLLADSDLGSPGLFATLDSLVDLEDFARYMLLNYWAGNTDWSHQNWYASSGGGGPDGRIRFHAWDSEHTLKEVSEDVTDKDDPGGPTGFHRRLMENPAYRDLFAEVVQGARSGGILDPAFTSRIYGKRLAEVDAAVRAESARWGDNRRRRPYTRGDEWMEERDRLLERWFPERAERVLRQLEEAGWLR